MPKKRKLLELYQLGREVTITDGNQSETVWLQKLSSVDADTAFRRAQGAKSRVLTTKRDPDCDEYRSAWLEAEMLGEDTDLLVDYLLAPERAQVLTAREAELAAEEEWSENDYLQGLRDAWDDGLKDTYAKNPEDPEASRVFVEMKRFADALDGIVDAEMEGRRKELSDHSLEDLREKVVDNILNYRSNAAWMDEYSRAEVWLGTRDAKNHDEPYFSSRAEVDQLAAKVLRELVTAFEAMRMDVVEGKGSEETAGSSPSSEPSEKEETADSSGLVAVSP